MILIFYMSSRDGSESGGMSEWLLHTDFGQLIMKILPALTEQGAELDIRKYAHMGEYALLAVPSSRFLMELKPADLPAYALLKALLFCILYAGLDEIHQVFVPGRAGTPTDVMIDTVGAIGGLLLVACWCLIRRKDLK